MTVGDWPYLVYNATKQKKLLRSNFLGYSKGKKGTGMRGLASTENIKVNRILA